MFRGEYRSIQKPNLKEIAESKKSVIKKEHYLVLANKHIDNVTFNAGHTAELVSLTGAHSLIARSEIYKVDERKSPSTEAEFRLFSILTARNIASRVENIPDEREREEAKKTLLTVLYKEAGQRDLVSSFNQLVEVKQLGYYPDEMVNTLLLDLYTSYRQCAATEEVLGHLYPKITESQKTEEYKKVEQKLEESKFKEAKELMTKHGVIEAPEPRRGRKK